MRWTIHNKCQASSDAGYLYVDHVGNALIVWREKRKWSKFGSVESIEDAVAVIERSVTP